jgi:hypothetical protein
MPGKIFVNYRRDGAAGDAHGVPDRRTALSGSWDKTVELWDLVH